MRISVVIATYRRAKSLRRTLSTIAAQSSRPEEVIIVDQSPPDERADVEKAAEEAQGAGLCVRLITSEPPSSTRSRNIGLAAAKGEWVVFSDDDVDWPDHTLAKLKAKVSASPDLALVAARDSCAPTDPRPLWRRFLAAIFLTNTLWPLRRGKVLACMQARYPQPIVGDMSTEWAAGYWFAVDRHFVSRMGLSFDERMTRYAQAEDMLFSHQLFMKAAPAGRTCVLSEDICVAHLVSQEWREAQDFADLCNAWNRIYIASTLRAGFRFWLSLFAICWAAIHQVLVRIMRGRAWLGHLRAHAVALANLQAIRSGDFERLYSRYERRR
ncbi:MAG: glycosyltransferase [Sphingomonadaceae bacterium]|jgi:glycosyltransferase involved in cell wall biosynthesis|nr:glycosyltransferase [Sphingomonadaceae bacterium]